MALVKKLNVELTIEDELVDSYISRGYSVIDDKGKIIKEAIPNDIASLKLLVAQQKQKIAELESKLALKETPVVKEKSAKEQQEKPVEVVKSKKKK